MSAGKINGFNGGRREFSAPSASPIRIESLLPLLCSFSSVFLFFFFFPPPPILIPRVVVSGG